MRNQDRDRCN